MTTFEAIVAVIIALKPALIPLITGLVGWLMPSPLQKAKQGQTDVANAEKKLSDSRGDVGGLDNLP